MGEELEERRSGGLKLAEGAVLVAVGAIGIVVAFYVLGAVVGFLWGLIKTAVVIGLIGGALYFLMRRRRRT